MILSVHQPQYLPWLGYFHKIANSGMFVYLDDVQFKKREYQNRNRIKTPNGPLWLTVPVLTKGQYTQNIKDVQIEPTSGWQQEHWKSIEHNYHKAPFFGEHGVFFEELYKQKWDKLMDVSMAIINYALKYLKIETPVKMSSELSISSSSTQRIADICLKTGADTYLSGAGGKGYMDESIFSKNNIKLLYQNFKHPEYSQLYGKFEPYLSVIDLLFNEGPASRDILLGNSR